ncbi:DUF6081 family protein [Actinomadura decatromicini]|uniref:Uncharacterized protein n=1 Tax=Actinomadura decatromicini TaxID=2604572 RepID=A0A5D3F8C6_9ACTN|nr:DUF6081 family protein [Actinomadura decatromicini]TYK44076.1 hypothetical protein FXF68_35785 [Actinomadura decatromicini]
MPERLDIVWDDFTEEFRAEGPAARWVYSAAGPHVADDGEVATGMGELHVVSRPFTRTIAPEDALPGTLDHVKWLAYTSHTGSAGLPGFDAPPGSELAFEASFTGRTHGTEAHPFGDAVLPDDPRLAAVAFNAFDPETFLVFDFFLTNTRIYAFYERLPFAREALGEYAAFSYAVPLVPRSPGDRHLLKIAYDRAAGVVRWLIEGAEVFRVSRIGHHLPGREHLVLDHSGTEHIAEPRQLNAGLGIFTLLDATGPDGGPGLVRISTDEGFYPAAEHFLDPASKESSRLFGQGAEFSAGPVRITRS